MNKSKKPILLIVRGVQGSGKSTFAKNIAKKSKFKHRENDQFFTDKNGNYHFDLSLHEEAKRTTFDQVMKDLKSRKNVVVSNTFNKLEEVEMYRAEAEKIGAIVQIYKMNMNFDSIHNIPKEIIEKAKLTYEPHPDEIAVSDYKVKFIE